MKDLSYFSMTLRIYLRENHPDVTDEQFIVRRGDAALAEYCGAINGGDNHLDAMERADTVLFSGLKFSKFAELKYIVDQWFDEILPENTNSFCLKILRKCRRIFDKYSPSNDFEMSPKYQNMQIELTGFIQNYIERYGVQ